ncbi:hypothetical protein ADL25_18320 [Streptomyces sp. NRRL F-5122]|nr:hypothetical protein ADL25_18320 [Streptomyces sp. NRRL F-5122]
MAPTLGDARYDASAVGATYAAHCGFRQGPGRHTGTNAPSVLCRRTTVATCCPHAGQTLSSLPMSSG